MLHNQLMQAIEKGAVKEVQAALDTAISQIKESKFENLDDFIHANILPAYINLNEKQFQDNYNSLVRVIFDCSEKLSTLKQMTTHASKDMQNFFYIMQAQHSIVALRKMAKEGYQPALNYLFNLFRLKSNTFRERAQILIRACAIMMKINPIGLSKKQLNILADNQNTDRVQLEIIANDRTNFKPSSKMYAYRRLAQTLLFEIDELKGKHPINVISYLLAKAKNYEGPEAEAIKKDLIHALKDAFELSDREIANELANAKEDVYPSEKSPVAATLERPAPFVPEHRISSQQIVYANVYPSLENVIIQAESKMVEPSAPIFAMPPTQPVKSNAFEELDNLFNQHDAELFAAIETFNNSNLSSTAQMIKSASIDSVAIATDLAKKPEPVVVEQTVAPIVVKKKKEEVILEPARENLLWV